MRTFSLFFALTLFGALAPLRAADLPSASKKPMVGKVGQTMAVQLDSEESQDFNLDLPKGQFFVIADFQRVGSDTQGKMGYNINASIYLLKRNGAQMPGYGSRLIYFDSGARTWREGAAFSFAKPTGVRFRATNKTDSISNLWLTVVPAKPVKFLPFGFGSTVRPAKIGSNKGTLGPSDKGGYEGAFEYLRVTIPKGKWSILLDAQTQEKSCYVTLRSLNARGFEYASYFYIDVHKNVREEKIVTLSKTTTFVFRVENNSSFSIATGLHGSANDGATDVENDGVTGVTYNVTIKPSAK